MTTRGLFEGPILWNARKKNYEEMVFPKDLTMDFDINFDGQKIRFERKDHKSVSIKSNVKKFVKKSPVTEAIQWTGDNRYECEEFVGQSLKMDTSTKEILVPTLSGNKYCHKTDWIVKTDNHQFNIYKTDVFKSEYQEIASDAFFSP